MHFSIIMRGRNCQDYIKKSLKCLINQTYTNWSATIILDAPEDDSYKIAKKIVKDDDRFKLFKNKKRMGVAYNMWYGVKRSNATNGDVIAWYDADDELPPKSLKIVSKVYKKNPKIALTYGSFWRLDKKKKTKTSRPLKKNVPVRRQKWHLSHLKTCKYELFQHLPIDCLKDSWGNWFQAASDVATMVPLSELAGPDRCQHVPEITYLWNMTKHKTKGHMQKRAKDEIYKKTPLKRLEVI